MRRVLICPTCLLLALLFTVNAQGNKITGIVYDNDRARIPFETPAGKITVYLPDDMAAGDVITGTVISEPAGKNEKEKAKNLEELAKYRLLLPDKNTISLQPATATPGGNIFTTHPFSVPAATGNSFPITINTPGNKPLTSASIPLLPGNLPAPAFTGFTLSRKVIPNDQPLTLLHGATEAPEVIISNYFSNAPAQSFTLTALAHSPRKTVYSLPPNLSGIFTVCVVSNGKAELVDLLNVLNLDASIGKGSLMKGEKTQMSITVTGLEGCPYRPVRLEIANNTTPIIRLENGDRQLLNIDQPELPPGMSLFSPFTTTQNVIGNGTGAFEINTVLHLPASSYENPVEPYLAEINSPEEFNSAMNALESDLNSFIAQHAEIEKSSLNYLQSTSATLPRAGTPGDLSRDKAYVYNIFHAIPGEVRDLMSFPSLDKLYPQIAEQANTPQLVHPIHDLAGEFDAATNELIVTDENKQPLLNYLDATMSADSTYSFTLTAENGQLVLFTNVKPKRPKSILEILGEAKGCGPARTAPQPAVPAKAGEFPKGSQSKPPQPGQPQKAAEPPRPTQKDNIGTGATPQVPQAGEQTKEPAKKDTIKKEESTLPEPASTFTDSTGRKYRFYKDSECQTLTPARKHDCKPNEESVWDPETKKYKQVATGKYERWDMLGMKICVRGAGFCTEMWQITSVQMIFEDKQCQRMIKVVNYENFSCQ